jgi:hypothetical protein
LTFQILSTLVMHILFDFWSNVDPVRVVAEHLRWSWADGKMGGHSSGSDSDKEEKKKKRRHSDSSSDSDSDREAKKSKKSKKSKKASSAPIRLEPCPTGLSGGAAPLRNAVSRCTESPHTA